ncbi:MAG: hypothetical protein EZS26_004076, partial [Candidatus Ordinivivax streblomastigis]
MEAKTVKREGKKSRGISAFLVIIIALILAESFFYFVFGADSNFEG